MECINQYAVTVIASKGRIHQTGKRSLLEATGEKRSKSKPLKLFHDSNQEAELEKTAGKAKPVNTQKEIEDFRSLIIRIIFAFVLFLSIFIIDKFNLQIGKVTPKTVEEYVTGNDSLQGIEDVIVSWLK